MLSVPSGSVSSHESRRLHGDGYAVQFRVTTPRVVHFRASIPVETVEALKGTVLCGGVHEIYTRRITTQPRAPSVCE